MKKKIIYFLLVATMFAVPVEGNSVVIQAADQALDVDEFSTDIVDDEEYERRLKLCSGCADLVGGLTCSHCGCFVLARARKRQTDCPMPGGSIWVKP